jgi:molybdate transport system ATP-binding protein
MSELALQIDHPGRGDFHLRVHSRVSLGGVSALFGASGSGKTTLLDCIAGLRPGIAARVAFEDEVWQDDKQHTAPWQRCVGYVFQEPRLFPHLTVRGNLDYAARRARHGSLNLQQVVDWLELTDLLDREPGTLSGGQQQRVAIARALIGNPRLLLLDEPLANLDREAAQHCLNCLSRLNRESELPMIYVSHQLEEICAIADQVLIMEAGEIVTQGPLLELASRLDTRLADDDAAAAILRVEPGEYDSHYGLSELRVDGQSLWVASAGATASRRRLRIPARDVSVCREAPVGSSILNVLPVSLSEVRALSQAHCLLRLRLREQYLLARITRRSLDELSLKPGDALFAQIKSTALLGDNSA